MLKNVSVKNYRLIESLELDLEPGFNILTGETGAGKSIFLGALSLVLGQRADSDTLFDKSRKCVVEARFSAEKDSAASEFIRTNDFETDAHIILRREISPEGRSRAFINDSPASLHQLKELGHLLVDIHSQHETLLLNRTDFQLSVLDGLAGNLSAVADYRKAYREWQHLRSVIAEMEEQESKALAEQDYLRFQLDELRDAAILPQEQSALETEQAALNNSGSIRERLEAVVDVLGGDEGNIVLRLSQLTSGLQTVSKFGHGIDSLNERLRSVLIELKDLLSEAEHISAAFQPDPARLQELESRLDVLYRLQKKHRAADTEALLKVQEDFEARIDRMVSISDSLASKKSEADVLEKKLAASAQALSASRRKVVPALEKTIRSMLSEVSLPNAVFHVELDSLHESAPGPSGSDKARFLFSANKGVLPAEIGKSASGGELSRLMLCIKATVASSMEMPVMIFDEIDSGISGETALRMGKVMKKLSRHHQLLAITHLPQMAGQGDAHFFVRKSHDKNRTVTQVVRLGDEERILEVARMLSGENPTTAALANARELLSR